MVISNTTEAGIVYRPEDRLEDAPPASFPGKIARLLWERYQAFHGVGGGLVFLPCELIEHNADVLKAVSYTHLDVYKRQGVNTGLSVCRYQRSKNS